MSHPVNPQAQPNTQAPASSGSIPGPPGPSESPMIDAAAQVTNLLKIFQKNGQVDLTADAAQSTLQALAQGLFPLQSANQHQLPHGHQIPVPFPAHPQQGMPGIGDPGPSSHPRGPPNLGQLSAVAAAAVQTPTIPSSAPPQEGEEPQQEGEEGGDKPKAPGSGTGAGTGRTRTARNAAMGSDEWARQRKDNHKEVERRRRGNINEGINELGRIVPNSSGEKAKGAILARAVQYIHHLKENEARNIEKWTLEKLLMDQAMGDLQAQLEEMRRLWEEERIARQRAEAELDVLRGVQGGVAPGNAPAPRPVPQSAAVPHVSPMPLSNQRSRSRSVEQQPDGAPATRSPFGEGEGEARPEENNNVEGVDGRPGKRARVE